MSTPDPCPCGKPTRPGLALCRECDRHTPRRLRELAGLVPDLELSHARLDRLGPATEGRGSSETPIPYRESAGQQLRIIRRTLTGWVAAGMPTGAHPLRSGGLAALAEGLARGWPHGRRHDRAGQFADDVARLLAQTVRTIDHPKIRSRVEVGPCPERVTDETDQTTDWCTGEIRAEFPVDPGERPTLSCQTCGALWTAEQWSRVGARIEARRTAITQTRTMASHWAARAARQIRSTP